MDEMQSKESILIVDDDESTRLSLALILGRKGYQSETAASGGEALVKARARFFNLALLDIKLPDMEGLGLLAPLKGMHPDMALIVVTGYASVETAVEALNKGASAYVTKPLNIDEVLVSVREALEKQRLVVENRRLYEEAQRELAERRRAEEALRESEKKYRTLFDEAKDGIVLVDRETGLIVDCNQEFERQTGRTLEQLQGLRIWEIRPPEKVELAKRKFHETSAAGAAGSTELEFQKPDGEIVPIEFVSRAVTIRDRQCLQSISRDITERKQAEKTLRESEERYRILFENSPISLWEEDFGRVQEHIDGLRHQGITDFKTYFEGNPEEVKRCAEMVDVIDVNEATLRLYRAGSKQDLLAGVTRTFTKESFDAFRTSLIALVEGKTDHQTEAIIKTLDGERIDVVLKWSIAPGHDRSSSRLLASIIDITERKRAEEALQASETLYRLLAENVTDIILTTDTDLRFTYVSPSVERQTGYSAEEVVGLLLAEVLTPESSEAVLKANAEELALEEREDRDRFRARTLELEVRCKDGSTIWTEVETTFLRGAEGKPRGILGVARDITDRKKAAAALRESEEHYAALVGNLTDAVFKLRGGEVTWCNDRVEEICGYPKGELLGKNASFFYPEECSPSEFARAVSRTIGERGFFRSTSKFRRKDGRLVDIEYSLSQIPGREPTEIVAVARDVTERKLAEEEIARHTRRVEALYDVARTLSGTLDLDELLDGALAKVDQVMGADTGTIHILDAGERKLLLKAHVGIPEEVLGRISTVDLSEEELQRLAGRTEPSAASSEAVDEYTLRFLKELGQEDSVQSFVTIPLSVKGQLQGVLSVSSHTAREFSPDDTELLRAIGHEIGVGIENSRLLERTRELSITDELTGLYNRRHFYALLDAEINRTQRYGRPFAMAMLDLDGFKEYNDRFGHTAGDGVLVAFARTLDAALRKSDTAFRYGGDEFVVVLPATDADRSIQIISRIRSKWSQVSKRRYGLHESPLRFSAGIAQFPGDAETADGLVFLADTALFRSKREGGNESTLVRELGALPADVIDTTSLDQVYALAATVDARDPSTYGHSKRVATLSGMLGKAVGLAGDELVQLHAAGLLHDIGKVGVPDSILTKPEKPARHEWKIIRQHSTEGARIVGYVKELEALATIIRHHHEWYDGTGYPDGLRGEAIPLGSRIISIADAYDTMTTPRLYREVISHAEACEELVRCSGTQFDPGLVGAFVRAMRETAKQERRR